jgi:hypothetical protein
MTRFACGRRKPGAGLFRVAEAGRGARLNPTGAN